MDRPLISQSGTKRPGCRSGTPNILFSTQASSSVPLRFDFGRPLFRVQLNHIRCCTVCATSNSFAPLFAHSQRLSAVKRADNSKCVPQRCLSPAWLPLQLPPPRPGVPTHIALSPPRHTAAPLPALPATVVGVRGAALPPPRAPSALQPPPATTHLGARGLAALAPARRPPSPLPATIRLGPSGPAAPPPPRMLSPPPAMTHLGARGPATPRALCAHPGRAVPLLQHTTPTCQPRSSPLSHRGLVLLHLTTATTPRGWSHSHPALPQLSKLLPLPPQAIPHQPPHMLLAQVLSNIAPGLALRKSSTTLKQCSC